LSISPFKIFQRSELKEGFTFEYN